MKAKVWTKEQFEAITALTMKFNAPMVLICDSSVVCDLSKVTGIIDYMKPPKGINLTTNLRDKICVFYL